MGSLAPHPPVAPPVPQITRPVPPPGSPNDLFFSAPPITFSLLLDLLSLVWGAAGIRRPSGVLDPEFPTSLDF